MAEPVPPPSRAPRLPLQSALQQARLQAVTAHADHDEDADSHVDRSRPSLFSRRQQPPRREDDGAVADVSACDRHQASLAGSSAAAYLHASAALRQLPENYAQVPLPRAALHRCVAADVDEAHSREIGSHRRGADAGVHDLRDTTHTEKAADADNDDDDAGSISSRSLSTCEPSSLRSPSKGDTSEAVEPEGGSRKEGSSRNGHHGDEEAVAERVLHVMQQKDATIARLTAQMQQLRSTTSQGPPPHTATARTTRETVGTRSRSRSGSSSSSAAARRRSSSTAPPLGDELRRREEELAMLREELSVAQQQWELKEAALEAREREAALFATHIKKLEMQLDDTLQEKKEDVGTLKEHIEHLQRELRDKAQEVKGKERRHQAELKALRQDMDALSDQFESQLGTVQQQRKMADDLAEAKRREQEIIFENQQMQRRWLRELEEQKRLVDELQRRRRQQDSPDEEAGDGGAAALGSGKEIGQAPSSYQQQQQQQQAMERKLQMLQWELQRRDGQFRELSTVHARTQEEVARLRLDAQLLTDNVSQLTLSLQHAEGQRDAAIAQAQSLQEALERAQAALSEKEAESRAAAVAHARQLESLLSEEDSRHQSVLTQVEGCVRSTEKLEAALLAAEKRRRHAEDKLRAVEDESAAALSAHRRAAAQARQDMLEQQTLSASVVEFHRDKLAEAHARLREQSEALAAVNARLVESEGQRENAAREHRDAEATNAQLVESHRGLLERQQRTAADLLKTKEELRTTLTQQLETTQRAQRTQDRFDRLQAQHQRQKQQLHAAREREQVLCRSLQELVLLARPLMAMRRRSSEKTHAGPTATPPSAASPVVGPLANGATKAAVPSPPPPPSLPAHASALPTATDVLIEGGEDKESFVAVSLSESTLNQSTATLGEDSGATVATVSEGSASRLSPTIFGATLRQLRWLRNGLPVLAREWAHTRRDVAAKSALMVQLRREKAQLVAARQADMEASQKRFAEAKALWERQREQLRHGRTEAVQEARAATQAECEEAFNAAQTARERTRVQQEQEARCTAAAAVAAEMTAFIQSLPTLLEECILLRSQRHRRQRIPAEQQGVAAGVVAGGAVADSTGTMCEAAMGASRRPRVEMMEAPRREIQAECDAIAKELLGVAGGFADLSAWAVAVGDSSGPAAFTGAAKDEEGSVVSPVAPPSSAPASQTPPPPAFAWEESQLQELAEVLTSYLAVKLSGTGDAEASQRKEMSTVMGAAVVPLATRPAVSAEESPSARAAAARTAALPLPPSLSPRPADGSLANALKRWTQPRRITHTNAGRQESGAGAGHRTLSDNGSDAHGAPSMMLTELLTVCARRSMEAVQGGEGGVDE